MLIANQLSALNCSVQLKIHLMCDICLDPTYFRTNIIDLGTNFNTYADNHRCQLWHYDHSAIAGIYGYLQKCGARSIGKCVRWCTTHRPPAWHFPTYVAWRTVCLREVKPGSVDGNRWVDRSEWLSSGYLGSGGGILTGSYASVDNHRCQLWHDRSAIIGIYGYLQKCRARSIGKCVRWCTTHRPPAWHFPTYVAWCTVRSREVEPSSVGGNRWVDRSEWLSTGYLGSGGGILTRSYASVDNHRCQLWHYNRSAIAGIYGYLQLRRLALCEVWIYSFLIQRYEILW